MLTPTHIHSAPKLLGLRKTHKFAVNRMKGIYVLVIQLDRNMDVRVGSLGRLHFLKGFYAYVGSAQNGLESRIRRHFRRDKKRFWHVDYFLNQPASRILKTYVVTADKARECDIAKKISERGEPVTGFGCSDCSCESHLVRVKEYGFLDEFMEDFSPDKFAD